MKVLTLVAAGQDCSDPEELRRREAMDEHPRASIYQDTLNSDLLDERFFSQASPMWQRIYRRMPTFLAQACEAFFLRKRYAAVITFSGKLGLAFAMILKLTRARTPHITLNSWISKPRTAISLKCLHSHISRIVLWSSVQRDYAVHSLNIPESKIAFTKWHVDQKFWRPMDTEPDMICSAGMEMRDYPTFIEALQGLDINCHIATEESRDQILSGCRVRYDMDAMPENITVGVLKPVELRALYARSRFVVVPLLPTDTDNGVSVTLEAMAMGKAVICSHVEGQKDVIQAGRTGIFVPQGDPEALRNAIQFLWTHPEEAERMGQAAREYVEKHHTIDQFVDIIKHVVDEAVAEKSPVRQRTGDEASENVIVENASVSD